MGLIVAMLGLMLRVLTPVLILQPVSSARPSLDTFGQQVKMDFAEPGKPAGIDHPTTGIVFKSVARDLVIQHKSRLAVLLQTKESATEMLGEVADVMKLLGRDDADPESTNETDYHADKAAEHADTMANIKDCEECSIAEQELLVVTEKARLAHEAAQNAAAFLGQASQAYAEALAGLNSASQDYNQFRDQMCPIQLTFDAAQSSFDALASAAQLLGQKAVIAQEWNSWEIGNKTIMDTAQEQYDSAAAAAVLADEPAAAAKAAEEAACGAFGLKTPAPTPPPTEPPTMADASAHHTCCLPNSIYRQLLPAGSLNPGSSIKLLIAKQAHYHVTYDGIAIGEQDGDGANMKPGTIASFNNGAKVGPVTADMWTDDLSYTIEADKNYLISTFVVVGPDGWVEWNDPGKKVFIRDWDNADHVTDAVWSPTRTMTDKMYNFKAIAVH